MAEYWKRPEQTAETLKNGWLHTGDIARADERGYMFILDRKKDMIVSGGFNIFPREVEDVLSQHADVAMVAVVGVPDDKWGEAVTAMVVAREGARPNAEELINLVKARKGSAHAPKQVKFVTRAADDRRRQGRQEGAEGRLLDRPRPHGGVGNGRRHPPAADSCGCRRRPAGIARSKSGLPSSTSAGMTPAIRCWRRGTSASGR